MIDAYQEGLDKIVYLRAWLDENDIDPTKNFGALPQPENMGARAVISMFNEQIYQCGLLRDLIERGL